MSTTLAISNTTFELLVGAFIAVLWAALAGTEAACKLFWRYRRGILRCTAIGAFVVVSAAFPVLPVGAALIAAFGWATWPR